jgi:hypothetical protein
LHRYRQARPCQRSQYVARREQGAKILELIGRPKGVTLDEIMTAVSWQAHSVRGYLSTAAKKHRFKIESAKNDAGERTYRIAT